VDTVCHNICTQLIFNRRFFQSRGIDSLVILHNVQINHVSSFSSREYPAKITTNLFEWCRQIALNPSQISETSDFPSFYCMICGAADHGVHDENIHQTFWDCMDPNLVKIIRDRTNKNFYELISSLITYLSKYPNSRASFVQVFNTFICCPFCQKKGANHDINRHAKWIKLWKIDMLPTNDPDPSQELGSYTRGVFDYLMDSWSVFHIPSFLMSLNNVRSFMEVLVSMWKILRVNVNSK